MPSLVAGGGFNGSQQSLQNKNKNYKKNINNFNNKNLNALFKFSQTKSDLRGLFTSYVTEPDWKRFLIAVSILIVNTTL